MTLNETATLDLFYDHLDEMKMGDACVQILNDEQFTEAEQEQVFGEILIPAAIVSFAEKYESIGDDSGEDLQTFWDAFLQFEHIPEELGNAIAATINDVVKTDDEDDGVMSVNDWDNLSDKERLIKVKKFLAALANSGDDARDIRPFIKRGPGPDPYGNEWGKNVKVFDRKTNRYGHSKNPTTERGTNSYIQRKPLPNLPIQESLLDVESAKKVERYASWMNANPWITKNVSTSESQAVALMEAGKLRAKAEKTFGLGKHEAEWDSVTDAILKGKPK
jgi:hypothetical protein